MNITVVGMGYVGLANAVLLAQHNKITAVDIDERRIKLISQKKSPVIDRELEQYLANKRLDITPTTATASVYDNADYVIVATPTNYNVETKQFDTSSVDSVIKEVTQVNPAATIVIKSTIPVGYTEKAKKDLGNTNIFFAPEFLREGKALYDNLYPSRIIIGGDSDRAKLFARLLLEGSKKPDAPVLFMQSTEAEAVKLFANTYLAMRVAYINELDTYAEVHGLDAAKVIKGISLDPRIGDYYNNPSFGYGGYCLPKDTKQLLASFDDIPNNLITAIVDANTTRMKHIADMVLRRKPHTVGIYRLTMKLDSDNFRQSSIQGVISNLVSAGVSILIYEPSLDGSSFEGLPIEPDLQSFKQQSDVIIANRTTPELQDCLDKVYSRDAFGRD